jgi:voltage-gated potassium channel
VLGFAAVEQGSNENVESTWDGLWWALTTMTTVGYGDITPVTESGRMIAAVVMVIGIGFLTLLIGSAAERFVSVDVEKVAEAEQEIASTEAELFGGGDLRTATPHRGECQTTRGGLSRRQR